MNSACSHAQPKDRTTSALDRPPLLTTSSILLSGKDCRKRLVVSRHVDALVVEGETIDERNGVQRLRIRGREHSDHQGLARRDMIALPQSLGVIAQLIFVHSSESFPTNIVGPFCDEKDHPM